MFRNLSMILHKICLFVLIFHLFFFPLWGHEKKIVSECKQKLDSLYPTYEEILKEDMATSLCFYHQLIEKNEARKCYDDFYVEALYRVPYFLVDHTRALETLKKIEIYDKNIPKIHIENGYLITDKIPSYMNEEEKSFFRKMMTASGLCESENDIDFSNDQIKVKLKPCCGCPKTNN